jgi:hypothetical protein
MLKKHFKKTMEEFLNQDINLEINIEKIEKKLTEDELKNINSSMEEQIEKKIIKFKNENEKSLFSHEIIKIKSEEKQKKILENNLKNLIFYSKKFLEIVMDKNFIDDLQVEIKCACYFIKQFSLKNKNENYESLIGSLIFLRIVNPIIFFPEKNGLFEDSIKITTNQRRNLMLITKIIQNISNYILFGKKEEYMICLNDFISGYFERVKKFLGDVCLNDEEIKNLKEKNNLIYLENLKSNLLKDKCFDFVAEIENCLTTNLVEFSKIEKEKETVDNLKDILSKISIKKVVVDTEKVEKKTNFFFALWEDLEIGDGLFCSNFNMNKTIKKDI